MEELLKILSGICPKVDFVNEKKLIDNGVLDSFDIIWSRITLTPLKRCWS